MRLERRGDGYEAELHDWQREMLANLIDQIRDLLLGGPSPILQRLYPTAYPSDAEANDSYNEMVHDQLLESQLAAIDTVEAHTAADGPIPMSEADVHQWMQAINSLRLVLGTRLDVSEDDDLRELDENDPDYPLRMMYDILSQMLGLILDVVS